MFNLGLLVISTSQMPSGYLSNQTKGVNGFVDANHTPPTPHLDASTKPSYTCVSCLVNSLTQGDVSV